MSLEYFYLRKDCEKVFQKNNLLLQKDKDTSSKRLFTSCSIQQFINELMTTQYNNFHESWIEDQPIKFSYDIDIKDIYFCNYDNINQLLTNLILFTIENFRTQLNQQYLIDDVIVLKNLQQVKKISYHIIFDNLKFDSYQQLKLFFNMLQEQYQEQYQQQHPDNTIQKVFQKIFHVDQAIYNRTSLRTIFSCKYGQNNPLIPIQMNIGGQLTREIKDISMIIKASLLTYTSHIQRKVIKLQDFQKIIQVKIPQQLTQKILKQRQQYLNIDITKILNNLGSDYYNDYYKWNTIGAALYNISTKRRNYFDLWDQWSSQSHKYIKDECKQKWNQYKNNTKITVASLIYYAKEAQIQDFVIINDDIQSIVNSYNSIENEQINYDNSIIQVINQKYLQQDIFQQCLTTNNIYIKSEKGTGKTSNLFQYLFTKDKKSSVLVLTSRVSFASKVFGDLQQYGFVYYQEIPNDYQWNSTNNRIVCQINSVSSRLKQFFFQKIIIDESESLLRYITSRHFSKDNQSDQTYMVFKFLITQAEFIYVMDADLSIRSIDFFQFINQRKCSILINEFKFFEQYTVEYSEYTSWVQQLLDTTQDNRIVIAMASNNKAIDIERLLRQKYPTKQILLINSEIPQLDKRKLLENVNESWVQQDIIIYTPTVCMGVSFDIQNYFQYIFAYGCHNSLQAEEFCQMIHRVRYPQYQKIYLTVDQFKQDTVDQYIDYQTTEEIIEQSLSWEICQVSDRTIYKQYELISSSDNSQQYDQLSNSFCDLDSISDQPLKQPTIKFKPIYTKQKPDYELFIRNVQESLNNVINFSSQLFSYIKQKKYKLEFSKKQQNKLILLQLTEIRNSWLQGKQKEQATKIIESGELISEQEYYHFIKFDQLSDLQFAQKRKYELTKMFNLNELTQDIIIQFNDKNKERIYRNLQKVIATKKQTTEQRLDDLQDLQNNYIKYKDEFKRLTDPNIHQKNKIVIDILHKFDNIDINKDNNLIPKQLFHLQINDIYQYCCQDTINKQILFNFRKRINISSSKFDTQRNFINSLIKLQYGLYFKLTQDRKFYQLVGQDIWNQLPDCNPDGQSLLQRKIFI